MIMMIAIFHFSGGLVVPICQINMINMLLENGDEKKTLNILSTAAPFYRVLGQSVMKRAEKTGFQKPPLFYGNPAVA